MKRQSYLLHIHGLPPIYVSYVPVPNNAAKWRLEYVKHSMPLTDQQQMLWQGYEPFYLEDMLAHHMANPTEFRYTEQKPPRR